MNRPLRDVVAWRPNGQLMSGWYSIRIRGVEVGNALNEEDAAVVKKWLCRATLKEIVSALGLPDDF